MKKIISGFEVLATVWIIYIFVGSLPYKFTGHEHTQFIFGTIGKWMSGIFGQGVGNIFGNYGAYFIGIGELIISLILMSGLYYRARRNEGKVSKAFGFGGFGAMILMIGAVFFHLATPLGIEVNNDGGSLFRAAVSIVIIGGIFTLRYFSVMKKMILKKVEKTRLGK